MATYRVYKFRGHEYYIPLFLGVDYSGDDTFADWVHFRVQLQGDLYLPESDVPFQNYVAAVLAQSFGALYHFSDKLQYPIHEDRKGLSFFFYGPPSFRDRVQVVTYVEPTSGDTEVVYRRARLRGDVLFFFLSPSAEVEDGEVHLGSLIRPAPRPLVIPEVAAKFREVDDCGVQEARSSAE